MKKTEETARELCRLDLLRCGVPQNEIPTLVERFWPVLANEIRQGIVVGEWPFSVNEIEGLTKEYQLLLERWLPIMRDRGAEQTSARPTTQGLGTAS